MCGVKQPHNTITHPYERTHAHSRDAHGKNTTEQGDGTDRAAAWVPINRNNGVGTDRAAAPWSCWCVVCGEASTMRSVVDGMDEGAY